MGVWEGEGGGGGMGKWDIGFSVYQKGDSYLRLMEFSVRMFCFHSTLV